MFIHIFIIFSPKMLFFTTLPSNQCKDERKTFLTYGVAVVFRHFFFISYIINFFFFNGFWTSFHFWCNFLALGCPFPPEAASASDFLSMFFPTSPSWFPLWSILASLSSNNWIFFEKNYKKRLLGGVPEKKNSQSLLPVALLNFLSPRNSSLVCK